jgi:hypothetical protein
MSSVGSYATRNFAISIDHAGHAVRKGIQEIHTEFLCGTILEKGDGNPRRSWKDNIKMDLGEL